MTRVLIGAADPNLVADLTGILQELGDFDVRPAVETTDEVADLVGRLRPELVFVHEDLGPQPASQLVRDLTGRHPGSSVLVLSETRTQGKLIKALSAGARGVLGYPFAYEDVGEHVDVALDWSRSMRSVLDGAVVTTGRRGRVATVVGAKGGVGTTTLATHLALNYLAEHPGRRVCLIDADVEKGDVSAILEVRQSVSIANVAKVVDDMTTQTVDDALIHHETGIHLLLAPVDVREAESVTPQALRSIVDVLRREFDAVIIDAGGHVSPTQAAAVEVADQAVLVTTADVLAVRAMRKRIQSWEALGVVEEAELRILVNKVDKSSLFPASAVERLTTATVLKTTIPLSPRVLEEAMNDRDPRSVSEAGWWRLIHDARREIGLGHDPAEQVEAPQRRRRGRRGAAANESGAIALENAAIIPLAMLLAVLCFQLAVIGLTFVYAGHAGAEAAREYGISGDASSAAAVARDVVPGPFAKGLSVTGGGDSIKVTLQVPMGFGSAVGLPQTLSATRGVVGEP
ncbi:AAA family ATPase [Janibacter sp. G56]|uniref:AAA family ATPase n=1 Tax=Janibacter sp. G56 TaxID=3418717 RepID=UPI003CFE088E